MTTYPPAIPTPGDYAYNEERIRECALCGTEIAPDESICDDCQRAAEIAETEGE